MFMVFFQVQNRNFGSIIFVDTSDDDGHMIVKIYHVIKKLIIIITRVRSGIFP